MVSPSPILRAVPSYRSPYGPKYHYQANIGGTPLKNLVGLGVRAGLFGGVALFGVIFFASGIPRIQRDILMKFPGLTSVYTKDIPASDNPF